MATEPDFDLDTAHQYFSKECFNRAWELIDKAGRSPQEDEEIILACLASLWHWTQREDCSLTNLSIGYWQVSRVYALLNQAENARRYAHLCLDISLEGGVLPFYLGYAYEALARAEALAGDHAQVEKYLAEAQRIAATIPNPQDRDQLLEDLEAIH